MNAASAPPKQPLSSFQPGERAGLKIGAWTAAGVIYPPNMTWYEVVEQKPPYTRLCDTVSGNLFYLVNTTMAQATEKMG